MKPLNKFLLARCREHAAYLDDAGLDGDGEDIRELIEYVKEVRSDTFAKNKRIDDLHHRINSLQVRMAENVTKLARMPAEDIWKQIVVAAHHAHVISPAQAAEMLGIGVEKFAREHPE